MEHQSKIVRGFGSADPMNLEDMSIQELVSVLRTAFLTEDFDRVEEVLVSRDKRLQTDILHLQEMVELEKLTRFQAEEDLRNREELCERGKRALNNYETLLKEVKKNTNLADRETIGELRKKKKELELEVCEPRKLKKKCVDQIELNDIYSRGFAARHEHVVDEQQENANVHMSDEINVVVPPTDVQKTQRKSKIKMFATNATSNYFDSFHFISLVHQERYSMFLTNQKIVSEINFQLEGDRFSVIQATIVSRGWVKLTSFAKVASKTLPKEFFANAYQDPAKENGNNKNDRIQYTSFVRGKKVPFDDKIINRLFGLENYEHCSFEARVAKGSNIVPQEVLSTLCRPEVNHIRNEDGTSRNQICSSDLTPIAKAWIKFISHTLLPCSNVTVLSNKKLALLIAILNGEPVNVGRLLANNLLVTANCSSPTSCIIHASLISKLCERAGVYPEMNEDIVKPYLLKLH